MNDWNKAGILVVENGRLSIFAFQEGQTYTLGRRSSTTTADILLDSNFVSHSHGWFMPMDSIWFYCDAGSSNGTYHNGKKIKSGMNSRVSPILLHSGDALRIEPQYAAGYNRKSVWMLFLSGPLLEKLRYFPLREGAHLTIGRGRDNCIILPEPYISAHHAELSCTSGACYARDLGSKAGTLLNGVPIMEPTLLRERDKLSICEYRLLCTGSGFLMYRKKR